MKITTSIFACFVLIQLSAQNFVRSQLPTSLNWPWEITYGPDNYLWISEENGNVLRVHPESGIKETVYTASDYFGGDVSENSIHCPSAQIGAGTLGLALHPNFLEDEFAFIFFVYSYNSGTSSNPSTKFRIKRLKWSHTSQTVVGDTNIVNNIQNGYDHLGGRLLAAEIEGKTFLYYSLGDLGMSEDNAPTCYQPQSTNPNNFTQDISTQNGKIHRFNIDGSIPDDNPISGNSLYTRGHRNPQGLMFNPNLNQVYAIEHGDRTDDEINLLIAGMNYGWKNVRGYHFDESYSGESNYVSNYVPNPQIENDALIPPIYSWCDEPNNSGTWSDWCTVAPSGGAYYGNENIPEWQNSLLVVTLKDGAVTDKEVFQLKLEEDGSLTPSTLANPNPKRFFSEDQNINGRLRDIAISNDGKKIFLINNGGTTDGQKIIVYEYVETSTIQDFVVTPNPGSDVISLIGLSSSKNVSSIKIYDVLGKEIAVEYDANFNLNVAHLPKGSYLIYAQIGINQIVEKFIKE